MSERLCLQWKDFKENAIGSLRSLRDERDFHDVTLACEDGKQIEAHKVILSISSPFFQNLLKRNKHLHPVIYMRGVKSDDLLAIVDFLYCGEAKVCQENLDSFLAIAEDLQLHGLMEKVNSEELSETKAELPFQEKEKRAQSYKSIISNSFPVPTNESKEDTTGISLAMTSYLTENFQELDAKCNSMMEKTLRKDKNGHLLYSCVVCGKEAINGALKKHIEANHLEGISIPCNYCDKIFRSRAARDMHNRYHHKNN